MKFLIIGRKRNGKGEFSKYLSQHLGNAETTGTSGYLVYRLSLILGISEAEVYSDKEKYRMALIDLGNSMCDADPGCLVSIALWGIDSKHIIVDGVRRVCEFEVVKDWFDVVIWVERPGENSGNDNCELGPKDAHIVITNAGSLTDLNRSAAMVAGGM